MNTTKKQIAIAALKTSAARFAYYDRKEDEELSHEDVRALCDSGELTEADIAAAFVGELRDNGIDVGPGIPPSRAYIATDRQRARSDAYATFEKMGQRECDVIEWLSANYEPLKRRAVEASEIATLLREIEWRGGTVDGLSSCPSCGEEPERGTDPDEPKRGTHADGCKLAALLARGAR